MAENPESKRGSIKAAIDALPLRGIATLRVEPDQVLVRIRAQQAELAKAKLVSLHGSDKP